MPILKNMTSSMGRMTSHILWKIENVPNHQPVMVADPDEKTSADPDLNLPISNTSIHTCHSIFNIGFCFQHISRPPVLFSEQILREPGCSLHLFHPQQLKPQRCRCCCAQCRLSKLRHYNYNLNICTFIYIQYIYLCIYIYVLMEELYVILHKMKIKYLQKISNYLNTIENNINYIKRKQLISLTLDICKYYQI